MVVSIIILFTSLQHRQIKLFKPAVQHHGRGTFVEEGNSGIFVKSLHCISFFSQLSRVD